MYPALREGDTLNIRYYQQPQNIQKVSPGKIVLLKDEQEWVVHRVIQRDGAVVTKGDWSYPLDNLSLAWGEVVAVNGTSNQATDSPLIARLSSNLNKKRPRLLRLIKKLQLMLISTVLRNLNERRSR